MSDLISRHAVIDAIKNSDVFVFYDNDTQVDDAIEIAIRSTKKSAINAISELLPSAQPERLTDDDFETIRIHLNAFKETLCNQRRWKEAEEYQCIIDRFMAFASAQPEEVIPHRNYKYLSDFWCECGNHLGKKGDVKYCSDCGKKMKWD